jgi:hypothetical protein
MEDTMSSMDYGGGPFNGVKEVEKQKGNNSDSNALLESIKSLESVAWGLIANKDLATDKHSRAVHSACCYFEDARKSLESLR